MPAEPSLIESRNNGNKNAMCLVGYYNDMNDEQRITFRKETFIPDGVFLELKNFEEFCKKYKDLLSQKI